MNNLYVVVSHDGSTVVDIDSAEIDKAEGLPCVEFELEILTINGLVINAAVIGSDKLPSIYSKNMKTVSLIQFLSSKYVESSNISLLDLPFMNEQFLSQIDSILPD